MTIEAIKQSTVKAVTSEVLHKVGLAYLVDDENRTWAVTRGNDVTTFEQLQPGKPCKLTLEHHDRFTIVGRCEVLN